VNHKRPRIALLTGGGDRPYALGIAEALTRTSVTIDFIGSDELKSKNLDENALVRFLNYKGNQDSQSSFFSKILRTLKYYICLIIYAAKSKNKIFHILWNNKFEYLDRTLLLFYYKILGKRIVHTAHNVNIAKRDSNDSWLNRFTLGIQYKLCSHIFVHTQTMKKELLMDFNVSDAKVTVIPFGINDTVPKTSIDKLEARSELGLDANSKTLLFFGNIAPYKGVDYLVDAFLKIAESDSNYRLLIAGRPKGEEDYWKSIEGKIEASPSKAKVLRTIKYIPDEDTELYFKSADVLLLPYSFIFQSGVLFLGYNFGLPIIATDVGSMKEDIVAGETGFIAKPKSSEDLAEKIETFFNSELYSKQEESASRIIDYANEKYSWQKVAEITNFVYRSL
jgi:glycosyltransferase involved in cell wall biosynthesis